MVVRPNEPPQRKAPMLQVITGRAETRACQRRFSRKLKSLLKAKGTYILGYQAGNFPEVVHSNGEIWFATGRIPERKNPCYWNCFGTDLWQNRSNSIVVEINLPNRGNSRAVSGIFAKDPATEDILLLHRGRIGGGRKGVGREAFTGWYRGEQVEIEEGSGAVGNAILVTSLSSPSFLDDLTYFVQNVA